MMDLDNPDKPASPGQAFIEAKPGTTTDGATEQCQRPRTCSQCARTGCGHRVVIYIWLSALTLLSLCNWVYYYGFDGNTHGKTVLERRIQSLEVAAEHGSLGTVADVTSTTETYAEYGFTNEQTIQELLDNITCLQKSMEKVVEQAESVITRLTWLESEQNLLRTNISCLQRDVIGQSSRLDSLETTAENLQTTQQGVLQHVMHNVGELGVSDQITYDMISHLDASIHNITGIQQELRERAVRLEKGIDAQARNILSVGDSANLIKQKQEAADERILLLESDVMGHDHRLHLAEIKTDTFNRTQQECCKQLHLTVRNAASPNTSEKIVAFVAILAHFAMKNPGL